MTVSRATTITCNDWLEPDNDDCDWSCYASHDGDGFVPANSGWMTVVWGHEDGEGEHYCPKCAKRRGLDDD